MSFKHTLAAVAVACLIGTPAIAQDVINGNTKTRVITVADQLGGPLDDTTVLFRSEGTTTWRSALPTDLSSFVVDGVGTKADLLLQSPSFGERRTSIDYSQHPDGSFLVQITEDSVAIKVLGDNRLWDVFERARPNTNPITPPPGQGCQLPDLANAYTSDAASGNQWVAYDCFKPERDGVITHEAWWGVYLDFTVFADCSPGFGDDFTVSYYADNAGAPGALIQAFPVTLRSKINTGNLILGAFAEYMYVSNFHAPLAVTGGECYWISVQNNGNGVCDWLWETSSDGDGTSWQRSPVLGIDQENFGDLAFCVSTLIQSAGCDVPPPPLLNDDCDDAEAISGEGQWSYDNSSATTDGGSEFLCDFFGQDGIDNDVWYCWTSPCDGDVLVETCGLTATDTKIAVYAECACPTSPNGPLACNDDACGLQTQVIFPAVTGRQYLIRVGNFPGAAGGPGAFNIVCLGPLRANDDCDQPEALTVGSTVFGSTTQMTMDAVPAIDGMSNTAPGVWYEVVGNGNRMQATTCGVGTNFDTRLGVYCGDCGDLNPVVGNDDSCGLTSEVEWDTAAGETYLVYVSGFGNATGNFELDLNDLGANYRTPISCGVPAVGDLDLDANVDGVFIRVSPSDRYLDGAGLTPFGLEFELDSNVTITAPTDWDGRRLMGWDVDGRTVGPHAGVIHGVIDTDRNVKAIYGERRHSGGRNWR